LNPVVPFTAHNKREASASWLVLPGEKLFNVSLHT